MSDPTDWTKGDERIVQAFCWIRSHFVILLVGFVMFTAGMCIGNLGAYERGVHDTAAQVKLVEQQKVEAKKAAEKAQREAADRKRREAALKEATLDGFVKEAKKEGPNLASIPFSTHGVDEADLSVDITDGDIPTVIAKFEKKWGVRVTSQIRESSWLVGTTRVVVAFVPK